jgi:hypothetical protein
VAQICGADCVVRNDHHTRPTFDLAHETRQVGAGFSSNAAASQDVDGKRRIATARRKDDGSFRGRP